MTDLLNIYNRVVEALERLGGFYNKSTMDNKLSQKSDNGHTHNYDSITGKPTTFTPSSHQHGAIQNGGTINSDIANVNKIVVTDGSNNIKTITKLPAANVTHQDISGKAPNDHSSTNTTYGVATNLKYGHVKVDDELKANSTNPVQNKVICEEFYTKDDVIELINSIETVHGKLLNIYIDEDTGDLVVNPDGFQYYNSDECDEKFTIGVEKLSTPEQGYLATYVIKQAGTAVGAAINIPKDFLLKSVSIKTSTANNNPISGINKGDKYFDFVFNTKDNNTSTGDEHWYLNAKDFVDVYTADETTITLVNNQFSIKSVPASKITGTLPANQVTHQDISGKVNTSDIIDNLNSTATNKPLSANQGNVIKGLLAGKSDNSHNHDGRYLTTHQDISGKANTADLARVATTGSYNDLTNKPTSMPPTIHNHPISNITNLQTSLDAKMTTSDYSTVTLSVEFEDGTTGTYPLVYRSS